MNKKIKQKLNPLAQAFGLSLIAIGLLLNNPIKSFQGMGAIIILLSEAYYFFKIIFK